MDVLKLRLPVYMNPETTPLELNIAFVSALLHDVCDCMP